MSEHYCHWPKCKIEVLPKMWGCRTHWFILPKYLRDRIWATYVPGQEIDKTPSREYMNVIRDIREYIAEKYPNVKSVNLKVETAKLKEDLDGIKFE